MNWAEKSLWQSMLFLSDAFPTSLKEAPISLQPHVFYLVPEETARVARAIFPAGNRVMRMYDELGAVLSQLNGQYNDRS